MVYSGKVTWRIVIALFIGLLCLTIPAQQALAADPIVTITVSKWIAGIPGGLTLTYIDDYEVEITWVKGVDAVNTMVRAKYGSYPIDRTDGYLVYYGNGIVANDTGVNFDEGVADVYYRAWSQSAEGHWEEVGAADFMENPYMLLIALVLLSMGFTIASYIFKKGMLAFAGAGAWIVTAIYCFSRSTETWDIYFSLAFLFIGLTIACFFSPLAWRETTDKGETPEEPDIQDLREEIEAFNRERNQYVFLHSKPSKRRARW